MRRGVREMAAAIFKITLMPDGTLTFHGGWPALAPILQATLRDYYSLRKDRASAMSADRSPSESSGGRKVSATR